ncbi:MAG: hypothetical protein A2Y25_06930 [Candidatus Melainabacteria bacterium GWF2_37_15]|nr:MAG: hypothetical protein A2Y25_06930 [Candidatus Melainabacteria bacterium GWF2_37_15]
MKINIEDIKKAQESKLEIYFSDYIDDLNLKDEVKAILVASASEYNVNIAGSIKAKLILECDRCLTEYIYDLDININEEFVNENIVPANQKEYELNENDFVVELKGNKQIDIKDLVYQSIILELPYKSLCRTACPGLESAQETEQKTEYIDERLEVFKSFSENRLSNTNTKEG